MASVDHLENVIVAERRPRRADGLMKLRAGLQGVEFAADARGVANRLRFVGDGSGDEARDARDLLALLDQQVGQIVVQLDGLHRLDEERRAGAGALVKDAGDGVAMIGCGPGCSSGRRA